VVAILGPGDFFGEGCLNGHPLRIATARAVDECLLTRIDNKATMIPTIHNEPEFSELFMTYLLSRNSRIDGNLIDQLFNSSEKRLAQLLLLLANFGKEGKPEPIVGNFSLAEVIGTTRSRVSQFMNKFRKLGFIDYNGKLEVQGMPTAMKKFAKVGNFEQSAFADSLSFEETSTTHILARVSCCI
jgi:CRP/FNR family transcriptional regulator, cyclic AMP receptor protein